MKKSVIWILVCVMAIAFFGLLSMQLKYFSIFIKERSTQFDESIRRSLYQVSVNLELDATKKYLDKSYQEFQKKQNVVSGDEMTYQQNYITVTPDGNFALQTTTTVRSKSSFGGTSSGSNGISRSFMSMQEEQTKNFLHNQDNVYAVISQLTRVPNTLPIEERVGFRALEGMIRSELKSSGIEQPFFYEVVDKNDKALYQQTGFENHGSDSAYPQVLFPNDPPNKFVYLKVYFPSKDDYLYSEITFLIPALLFTFILLVTFIIMIIMVVRQKRLSEMKSDFMNNMTHELKTPVSTISLAAQMLKDTNVSKSPDVFKHISSVIGDETERLSFQVEKVLQMSLFEKQQATLKIKELDANDIIVHVASTFQLKVEKFGGHIDIDLQATESTIKADKMHFTNVLFNLLDNAVKYRREDVDLELMIRSWNSGNKIYISVEDNGIGIKKEAVKRIFDRFYRVSTGNLHDVKGFGLGLAYVHKIVTDHKGTIKAESELGKGTKFIICLPYVTERN